MSSQDEPGGIGAGPCAVAQEFGGLFHSAVGEVGMQMMMMEYKLIYEVKCLRFRENVP